MQVTMTIEDLGTLLRVWRSQARLTGREVAEMASAALGREMSYMMVSRYENNDFPDAGPDPAILAAITISLGRRISDLPPEHELAVEKLGQLIVKNRCSYRNARSAA